MIADLQTALKGFTAWSSDVDQVVECLTRALALRDSDTEEHARRVTAMTLDLAQAVEFLPTELIHLRRGSILHDIGKIGIPDFILHKDTPFTGEERDIMRMHPVYGYELLSTIPRLHPALDIPYCHHEKGDGSGYPRGLKGTRIPFSARLFAIVDVWDALLSNRPYRPAWTVEQASQYMLAQSGKHFDPDITRLFLDEVLEGNMVAARNVKAAVLQLALN